MIRWVTTVMFLREFGLFIILFGLTMRRRRRDNRKDARGMEHTLKLGVSSGV